MVGIVGFYSTHNAASPSRLLQRMSDAMAHRGQESLVVSDQGLSGHFAFAVRSPLSQDHFALRADKQTLVVCSWNDCQGTVEHLLKSGVATLKSDMAFEHPELADALIIGADGSDLVVSRYGHSTNPVYFQWSEGSLAFSTERKPLWSIGLYNSMELEPNQTLRVDLRHPQPVVSTCEESYPRTDKNRSREDFLTSLQSCLENCFGSLRAAERVGVLFSGGVDSSLAALLAKKVCREVTLFTACAEGSHDEESASTAARGLGLQLEIAPFDSDTVWENLPEIIYAIETTRQIDIEIALPFFIAARAARSSGETALISGQGPDELFGGYAKHAKLFAENGEDALDEELRSEVQQTHKTNIARDERAVGYNGLSAFFPYLNSRFILEALAVPSRWKISSDNPPERKAIFRQLAINMGLPEIIAFSPKKATQYSSGSQKALSRAISERTECPPQLENKDKSQLTKIVLDRIAMEVGFPIRSEPIAELRIDLEAAHKFAQRIRTTSHPQ